ncbi:MAG: V-type ATPase 116kDa subunit family-domain-containing protein [Olpidium bornovanus]|uniref:V-type proton ATPase subunit a n=1 Tax=Olpidium bornovanus TaxID=278681 RepID=A0A8H8A1T5_9FUNG|nr:MAG: V-type ATPase 116kDa subunit family-domain-containing protein [Olpidium bornovanus]
MPRRAARRRHAEPEAGRMQVDLDAVQSSLFRSEEMALVQLYIPSEVAQLTVSALGEMGVVHFRDVSLEKRPGKRVPFRAGPRAGNAACESRRSLEAIASYVAAEQRLGGVPTRFRQRGFLSSQIEKENIQIRPTTTLRVSRTSGARTAREIDELEEQLSLHENRVLQMNTGMETLKSRYLELTELGHVLRETARFFEAAYDREEDIRHSTEDLRDPLLRRDLEANAVDYGRRSGTITIGCVSGKFYCECYSSATVSNNTEDYTLPRPSFVAGTIPRARMASFERILWRALRGNLYMNSAEIEDPIVDPHTDDASEKNVFIIFAHGTELLAKIRKISDSLGGTLYAIDADADRRREMALEVSSRIEDLTNVRMVVWFVRNVGILSAGWGPLTKARHHELARVSTRVTDWSTIIKKEKAIYHAMNLFNYDPNRKCLIAEAWCPCAAIGPVQQTMRQVIDRCGANVPSILHELRTAKEPPTYHRTNKVTKGFQGIIDAYGVAQYREVNPGLFTVITFPFFFAVMFGDLGHGFMVTMFALWMVMNERRLAAQENHEVRLFDASRFWSWTAATLRIVLLTVGHSLRTWSGNRSSQCSSEAGTSFL